MVLRAILDKINFKYVAAVVVTCVLFYIARNYYRERFLKKINPEYSENKEFISTDPITVENEIKMYFFSVNWCPYCKVATPIWNAFSKKHALSRIRGKRVAFKTIDCSNMDEDIVIQNTKDSKNNDLTENGSKTRVIDKVSVKCKNLPPEAYDLVDDSKNPVVTGYPTIVLIDGKYHQGKRNNIYVLESKITEENLNKFLKKSTMYKST